MSPPLTTSMTVPVTMPSSSLIFSIVPQARSYCARFLDRMRRPSLSSFWRTRASISSPTLTTSFGSTSCLIELAARDHAFGLVTDVEENLVPVYLDDDAIDDVTVVEVLDRLVDRGEECFLVTDVVDRNLRSGGGGLGAARHVGKGSGTDIEVVGTATPGARDRTAEGRTVQEAPLPKGAPR